MKSFLLLLLSSFCLSALSAIQYDFVVAKDGSENYATVQEAINAVPDYRKVRTIILIKKGVYKEKIVLADSKKMVTLLGEAKDSTILTYDDYASKKNIFGEDKGTSGSASFYVFGEDFRAENLTFQNSSGPVGQAVAVLVKGDRAVFINCNFWGFQDTLYTYGDQNHTSRQYYKDCYIEGSTDFIFGWATAWFEGCTLYGKLSGFYTAASTPQESKYGYIFHHCRVTGNAPNQSFYLGRPWRPYASVAFLECELDNQVRSEGWHNWQKPDAEKTTRYAEYKNTGPGAANEARVKWVKQLTDEEAKNYTLALVLGGDDQWNP
jgi:pectinesterase